MTVPTLEDAMQGLTEEATARGLREWTIEAARAWT
jgi:hypothetical protein